MLRPNFPFEKIIIPLGFSPSKKLFSEKSGADKEGNIIDEIAIQISKQTNYDQKEIFQEIRQMEKEKNLFSEVAALCVARKYGVDITDWYDSVEKILVNENIE